MKKINCPFTKIEVAPQNRDNFKTAKFFEQNGIEAYTVFLPWDNERLTVVHFVSATRGGDEYGQFVTIEEAIKKAQFMANVPMEERRQYDQ